MAAENYYRAVSRTYAHTQAIKAKKDGNETELKHWVDGVRNCRSINDVDLSILFIDDDKSVAEAYCALSEQTKNKKIMITRDYDSAICACTDKFDVVFLDSMEGQWKEILEWIKLYNPDAKVYANSGDSLICNEMELYDCLPCNKSVDKICKILGVDL
jgi:hypothetical protein